MAEWKPCLELGGEPRSRTRRPGMYGTALGRLRPQVLQRRPTSTVRSASVSFAAFTAIGASACLVSQGGGMAAEGARGPERSPPGWRGARRAARACIG